MRIFNFGHLMTLEITTHIFAPPLRTNLLAPLTLPVTSVYASERGVTPTVPILAVAA